MSKEKELLKKEFETIANLQSTNSQNINQLGILEFQIQKLNQEKLNITNTIQQTEEKFQNELKKLEELELCKKHIADMKKKN